jgi:hypothetical protein
VELENLALRQLHVLRRKRPGRLRVCNFDRLLSASAQFEMVELSARLGLQDPTQWGQPGRVPSATGEPQGQLGKSKDDVGGALAYAGLRARCNRREAIEHRI